MYLLVHNIQQGNGDLRCQATALLSIYTAWAATTNQPTPKMLGLEAPCAISVIRYRADHSD